MIYIEKCFCGSFASLMPCPDLAQQRNQFDRSSSKTKLDPNSTDKFGHVWECAFCKCHYHWILSCPYAPALIKKEFEYKCKHKPVEQYRSPSHRSQDFRCTSQWSGKSPPPMSNWSCHRKIIVGKVKLRTWHEENIETIINKRSVKGSKRSN